MAEKKPTLELWSTRQGKIVDFEVSVENNEIVAENDGEFVKFPGGITKTELMKLVKAHNKANDGVKAITEEDLKATTEEGRCC